MLSVEAELQELNKNFGNFANEYVVKKYFHHAPFFSWVKVKANRFFKIFWNIIFNGNSIAARHRDSRRTVRRGWSIFEDDKVDDEWSIANELWKVSHNGANNTLLWNRDERAPLKNPFGKCRRHSSPYQKWLLMHSVSSFQFLIWLLSSLLLLLQIDSFCCFFTFRFYQPFFYLFF